MTDDIAIGASKTMTQILHVARTLKKKKHMYWEMKRESSLKRQF